jgi:hypothetical protein
VVEGEDASERLRQAMYFEVCHYVPRRGEERGCLDEAVIQAPSTRC